MPAKLLIANRGEIAVRILRAAAELGMRTVGVFSQDDAESLHRRLADESCALAKTGAAAYLDIDAILRAAKDTGCDAIHPGYGFLSENADFARRCAEANLTFVGPRPEVLALFGNKAHARATAERLGVPILSGTSEPTSLSEAVDFFDALPATGAMLIKAIGGGGGRGMRVVRRREELEDAYARCQSEARAAFGNGDVYVEQLLPRARHVEVQIVGDGSGAVSHLGERDCSIQRRHQKLVEIAPAPGLPDGLRQRLVTAATTLAASVRYDNVGTFEFLVDASALSPQSSFAFIEANPRLQVEHTVTEEVYGVDLVAIQLELAGGRSLADLGLLQVDVPAPRGVAIQARINMETMQADGATWPSSGTLSAFVPACGPGIRVDTFGYAGYTPSGRFDALLVKLVVCHPSGRFEYAVSRLQRALAEFRVDGVAVNIPFLQRLLRHPAFRSAFPHPLHRRSPRRARCPGRVCPDCPRTSKRTARTRHRKRAASPAGRTPRTGARPTAGAPDRQAARHRPRCVTPARHHRQRRGARGRHGTNRTTAGCGGIHEDGARGSRRRGRRCATRRRERGGRHQRGRAAAVRGKLGVVREH